jgi:hypothetical protein
MKGTSATVTVLCGHALGRLSMQYMFPSFHFGCMILDVGGKRILGLPHRGSCGLSQVLLLLYQAERYSKRVEVHGWLLTIPSAAMSLGQQYQSSKCISSFQFSLQDTKMFSSLVVAVSFLMAMVHAQSPIGEMLIGRPILYKCRVVCSTTNDTRKLKMFRNS